MYPTKRFRRGFTLFQLLVVLAILLILLGLLLPAIVKARLAELRMQGSNNLKQLMLGTMNCAATYQQQLPPIIGSYPQGVQFGANGTLHYILLPFLGQQNIFNLSNDGTCCRVSYEGTAAAVVKVFLAHNDPSSPPDHLYDGWLALCNYPANYLVFEKGNNRFPASITDGTSNTIFFAQRYQMCNGQPHAWGYDGWYYWAPMFAYYSTALFQAAPAVEKCDPERTQALSPDGIQVGLGDGSVRFLTPKLNALTWLLACQPNDGLPMPADW